MTDIITITGLVATDPRHIVTSEGLPITNFRLVSNQRRFDRTQDRWVDGDSNWYTITSFRQLAINGASSLKKGERVVITGRLRLREWDNGERKGMNIDIEADAIGHDLAWGTSSFSRSISSTSANTHDPADADSSPAQAPDHVPIAEEWAVPGAVGPGEFPQTSIDRVLESDSAALPF